MSTVSTSEQEPQGSALLSSGSLHAYQHPAQGLPIEGKCECCCTSCGLPESSSVHSVVSVHVEHPGDVCECGHTRERHGSATPGGEHYCGVKEPDENGGMSYVDECEDFVLAQTALDAACRQADAANFDDEEADVRTYCDECGCWDGYHSREAGCVECPCIVGMAVLPPERPADAARCGACGHATQPHLCDSGACDQYACECPPCGECGHPSTTRGLPDGCCRLCECVTGMPSFIPIAQEQQGYDGYAVTYAVAGGQQFTLYVPNGANVCVIDGQIRVYHLGQPALGITDVHTREA